MSSLQKKVAWRLQVQTNTTISKEHIMLKGKLNFLLSYLEGKWTTYPIDCTDKWNNFVRCQPCPWWWGDQGDQCFQCKSAKVQSFAASKFILWNHNVGIAPRAVTEVCVCVVCSSCWNEIHMQQRMDATCKRMPLVLSIISKIIWSITSHQSSVNKLYFLWAIHFGNFEFMIEIRKDHFMWQG